VYLTAVLGLLLSYSALATTFQLQTIDQQIKETDGIVMGHYLKKKTIKLEDGTLATQMIFKMSKEFGLQSELFGMDEVIIHYPGGQFEGQTVKVEGVPSFVSGEKVVLMIKSVNNRYWGLNLGFGTFKVINYGKETILVNTLFPMDPQVGQVKMEDFEKSVKLIKKSSLKVVLTPEYPTEEESVETARMPASVSEGKKRAIASNLEQSENEVSQPRLNTYWLVLGLALLGGLFRFIRQKEAR